MKLITIISCRSEQNAKVIANYLKCFYTYTGTDWIVLGTEKHEDKFANYIKKNLLMFSESAKSKS